MNSILFSIIAVISIASGSYLYAQSQTSQVPQRKTIAVMNFEANNCPPALGRALTDLLAGRIFKSPHFILLERNQIEMVLKDKKYIPKKSLKDDDAARLGSLLEVEKVVVGSVSKFDNYIVEIRIIDVKKRTVDISISRETDNAIDLKDIVSVIHQRIDNHYSGYKALSGKYDFSIAPTFFYTSDGFTKNVRSGFGIHAEFTFNTLINKQFPLGVSAAFYSLVPEKKYIRSFYMAPLAITISYPVHLSDTVRFVPGLGAGYLFSRITADEYESRLSGEYRYTTEYYYNPMLHIKPEFNFKVSHGYFIVCAPYYMMFFEADRVNSIGGINFGVRVLF